jgi:hypothetical protein
MLCLNEATVPLSRTVICGYMDNLLFGHVSHFVAVPMNFISSCQMIPLLSWDVGFATFALECPVYVRARKCLRQRYLTAPIEVANHEAIDLGSLDNLICSMHGRKRNLCHMSLDPQFFENVL